MHARQLTETAGLVSLRARPLVQSGAPISSDALAEYWIASRCRLDHWGRALRGLGHSHSSPPPSRAGDLLTQLVEELTLSETLVRVVAAVCLAHDRGADQADHAEPIAENLLAAHREATSRLRALIFAWWAHESPRAQHARTLSSQAEHWTDALLAHVAPPEQIEHLAHDRERLREFAQDRFNHTGEAGRVANALVALSLQAAFSAAKQPPLNAELNRRIAGAAIALFGQQGFDEHGLAQSAWMVRARRVVDDTATLLSRLFCEETNASPIPLPERWRL